MDLETEATIKTSDNQMVTTKHIRVGEPGNLTDQTIIETTIKTIQQSCSIALFRGAKMVMG
jgi:hypothetical protein